MTANFFAPTQRLLRLPRPNWDQLSFLLFVVAAILVLATFTDYGVTWDADAQHWYGRDVLSYYLSGFSDFHFMQDYDLYNYGAAFDMTAAAIDRVSPFGTYETHHLLGGMVGLFGVLGAWKLGRAIAGPRAGFIAALFLLMTPNYYGQMFNNPKDIPFAVGMVWSIYYIVRLIPALPRPPWIMVAKLGLAAGFALGVRVGGFLIFGYLGLALLSFAIWRGLEARRLGATVADLFTGTWRAFLPALAIAYPVMLAFWPWAQQDPLRHPVESLLYFSHEIYPYRTLFAGEYVPATDLPWAYLPVYILLALPELLIVILVLSPTILAGIARQHERVKTLRLFILGFAIVFPVLYAVAIKAVLFDGMRHFIFVLPLIAGFTAVIGDRMLDYIARLPLRHWAYGGLALYGIAHVAVMGMLHPDEYVYYNGFIGGVEGAAGSFKLDYWANSYAEAVGGLETYLKAEYGADFMDHDFTVAVCGPPISAAYYFPSNFIFAGNRDSAEFFIAFTKDDCDKALPGKEIYRVERMGTLLSVVLDRREILAQASRQRLARRK